MSFDRSFAIDFRLFPTPHFVKIIVTILLFIIVIARELSAFLRTKLCEKYSRIQIAMEIAQNKSRKMNENIESIRLQLFFDKTHLNAKILD